MKIFLFEIVSIAPGFNSGFDGNTRFKADPQFFNKASMLYRPKNDFFEQNSDEPNNE